MPSADKPAILIYANCQGGAIAHALRGCPTIADVYDVENWENFPGDGAADQIPQAFKQRCEIFIHQVGDWGRESPAAEGLPGGALTLHFPPSASNAMFPLRGHWPDSVARSAWPFRLHIDFTDRVAIDLALRMADKPDYIAAYNRADIEAEANAGRRHEFDLMWMARNDAIADIAMGDVLAEKMRSERICWMPGHLTNRVLHVLVHRIVTRLGADIVVPFRSQRRAIAAELRAVFEGPDYFRAMQVPIHPTVAGVLGLDWYDPDYCYCHAEDARWTHREFIAAIHDYVNGRPMQE